MNCNLLILGAGQYGMVAKETAEAMGCFGEIGFLDDSSDLAIGRLLEYEAHVADYTYAFVAIGDAALRLELIRRLEEACFRIAVLVSPKAYVSPSAQLMRGTLVEPMAVVQANAALCVGVFACAGSVVNHNAFVGDACQLDCGSVVAASAVLPARRKLGYCEAYLGMDKAAQGKRPPQEYTFENGM